jgi:HlyD family secretion protein
MKRAPIIVLALLLAAGAAWWFFLRGAPPPPGFQGYIEGYLVLMAPQESGRIAEQRVEPGDRVTQGQLLFALDPSVEEAQRGEAVARLGQAQADLANLRMAGQRPEQIAVLRAKEQQAKANLDLSAADLERLGPLLKSGVISQQRFDQAKSTRDRDQAALEEARRQIEAAELIGRKAEIDAAEAAVRAAQAALERADTKLAQRKVFAPADARVQDVYFRAGEVVNAGQPVLALLPPHNLRIRFYIPEPVLSTLRLGQAVTVTCDSCPQNLGGKISFISSEAEYTPPIIFSQEERAKLVFRAEARPTGEMSLPIGLPVNVLPSAEGAR